MTELSAAARVLGVDSAAHPLASDVEYLKLVALVSAVQIFSGSYGMGW
jgi:hypothetical protein